jgi:hypothetical protein
MQATLEGLDDLLLVQPQAARTTHGQNEGPAELGVVVGIELLDAGELRRGAIGQTCPGLFVGGFRGERLAHHGLAGQFGVGADQAQLRVAASCLQYLRHGVLEMGQRAEGPLCEGALGDPVRVFVQAGQQTRRVRLGGVIELVQGQGHSRLA